MGFPGGSVKNPPAAQQTRVQSLGREDPLEKAVAIHSTILAWRIPWTEEPGGLQSMVSQRVGHECTGKSRAVSCGVIAPFFWVLVHKVLLYPSRVYFPVLCKFLRLYGGVNGHLLQEGLCHTQDCRTQSLCPCGIPPPTCTFIGDAQTRFSLSLCGVPASVHTRFVSAL